MKFVYNALTLLVLSSTNAYAGSTLLGMPPSITLLLAVFLTAMIVGALVYFVMANQSGDMEGSSEVIDAIRDVVKTEDLATAIQCPDSDQELVKMVNVLLEQASNQVTKEMIGKSTAEANVAELEEQIEGLNQTLATCYEQQQTSGEMLSPVESSSLDQGELLSLSAQLSDKLAELSSGSENGMQSANTVITEVSGLTDEVIHASGVIKKLEETV